MDSSLISKVEKAKRYAEQQERITFTALSLRFRGDNGTHQVQFDGRKWSCDCGYFHTHHTCSHSMAMERVLHGMLPALQAVP